MCLAEQRLLSQTSLESKIFMCDALQWMMDGIQVTPNYQITRKLPVVIPRDRC